MTLVDQQSGHAGLVSPDWFKAFTGEHETPSFGLRVVDRNEGEVASIHHCDYEASPVFATVERKHFDRHVIAYMKKALGGRRKQHESVLWAAAAMLPALLVVHVRLALLERQVQEIVANKDQRGAARSRFDAELGMLEAGLNIHKQPLVPPDPEDVTLFS